MIDPNRKPHKHGDAGARFCGDNTCEYQCENCRLRGIEPGKAPARQECGRKPHVHAAVIKAWADGATIQWKDAGQWYDVNGSPVWNENTEYRVKPTPHKWQKEMDAAREGKTIQWRFPHMGWSRWPAAKEALKTMVGWNDPGYEFRIEPWPVEVLYEVVDGHLEKCAPLAKAHLRCTFEEGKLIAAKVLPS
jgi:hypothetical protein